MPIERSKYWYIFDKVLLPASLHEGRNKTSRGGKLHKVLKFQKSHRKASVLKPLFKKSYMLTICTGVFPLIWQNI